MTRNEVCAVSATSRSMGPTRKPARDSCFAGSGSDEDQQSQQPDDADLQQRLEDLVVGGEMNARVERAVAPPQQRSLGHDGPNDFVVAGTGVDVCACDLRCRRCP